MVLLGPRVHKDLRALKGTPETLGLQDRQGPLVLRARRATQAILVRRALPAPLGQPAPLVQPELQVQLVRKALLAQ